MSNEVQFLKQLTFNSDCYLLWNVLNSIAGAVLFFCKLKLKSNYIIFKLIIKSNILKSWITSSNCRDLLSKSAFMSFRLSFSSDSASILPIDFKASFLISTASTSSASSQVHAQCRSEKIGICNLLQPLILNNAYKTSFKFIYKYHRKYTHKSG